MIESFVIKVLIGLVGCGAFAIFFYQNGKKAERYKQIEGTINEARKTHRRKANRRNDSISTVRNRMQKDVRK